MAFDQPTRNRLARFVGDSRTLLTEEFTRQLQHDYGLDPASGDVTDLARLDHLDDARRETARLLRETLAYYLAGQPKPTPKARRESLERIVREQAFTVLNRLCALRMMEARGLLLESVGRGYQSKGFQLYSRLAGPALGETGDAYRSYLFSLFDEFAVDLPVLFDRFSPQGRLFPRPTTLLQLLDEINHPDIDLLWAEDETIGWIYQYFNSVEERRQMRAESQAPRNSRELAVRNQFFTPRYVVEFLTDNTLGRLWYEMTQGQTALTECCHYLVRRPTEIFLAEGESPPHLEGEGDLGGEGLSQEELLKQPVYIPYRPLKDPRDLKMLDPACGSMHFGLYAFDLFEQIYLEAWALEAERGPYALIRPPGLKPLCETYPDEAAFRREVPRLIIEHDIHGIDIDPRAVQIAGLSLWLRAQKSWQNQGVKPQERPTVTRSNVVTAEPMPGDVALLDEFIARHLSRTPEDKLLGQLLRRVFEAMKLAGEAGSLLRIEETIAADIAEAKAKWYAQPEPKQASFLQEAPQPEQAELGLDVSGITDAAFWGKVEGQIYNALRQYAQQAENSHSYRRRLFASDAERGFAFIDLCRKNFDCGLANPPFGNPSAKSKNYIARRYPVSKVDLLASFIEMLEARLYSNGMVGVITNRTALFLKSFNSWRKQCIVENATITLIGDLGLGVLDDAMVETSAYIIQCNVMQSHYGVAFQATNIDVSKDSYLERCVSEVNTEKKASNTFIFSIESFRNVPNYTLCYWIPTKTLTLFTTLPPLESDTRKVERGLFTSDDFRYLRLVWEVPPQYIEFSKKWSHLSKGGEYSPFFYDIHLLILSETDFAEIKATVIDKYPYLKGNTDWVLHPECQYGRPGLTYPLRTTSDFGPRILPAGCFWTNKGISIFASNRGEDNNLTLLGVVNSKPFRYLVHSLVGAAEGAAKAYEEGLVASIPFPSFTEHEAEKISRGSKQIVDTLITLSYHDETSRYFQSPARGESSPAAYADLVEILSQIDDLVFNKYGFGVAEKRAAEDFFEQNGFLLDGVVTTNIANTTQYDPVSEFSYCLGVILGRCDIRRAIGEKGPPELPDPFAPLPPCPPGMLQDARGLPATPADVPPDYPLRISWPSILVDDPGHPEDIESRIRKALRVIWPDNADAIEQEACQILGVLSLRAYFSNPNQFFNDHLRRYSKSRRVAPIYWPLSTPSGSYTLWLYYHRLDNQILYTCVNDFVDPKLKDVTGQVQALRQKSDRSKAEEDDLARLTDLETELQDLRAELLHLAAIWWPNLNDGVQITAAPLWRLFQHRQWQKRLKDTWDKLAAGDYDWAHLAMSIWPERVVPKCVEDRSLAIAHDLEDLFWVEDEGSWRLLQKAEQEIAGQIKRRQMAAHNRLGRHLADLAANAGRGMPAYQVWQHLSEGDWDDTPVALALWPERVAEKCWDQPFLAAQLGLKLPNKRTKAHRERFLKKLLADSAPDLADAVAAAFQDESDAFDAVWQALAAGERDEQPLALALWPERVVDKCAGNLELAAQHHLRRYFWVQPLNGGPWRRRNPQAQEIRDEIARRKGG